jgi:hypothetical protein
MQLHHDREAKRDWDGRTGHLPRHLGIGVNYYLGLSAGEPGHFLGARYPLGSCGYDRSDTIGGVYGEPDAVAVESPDQRLATALEQLTVGTGMATRSSEGAGQRGEGRQRGELSICKCNIAIV